MESIEQISIEELDQFCIDNQDLLQEYIKILDNLKTNRISKKIVEEMQGLPISEICRQIEEAEAEVTSNLLFRGDLVLVYPRIKEQRSRTYRTCDFSGGIITPGSFYISYNPLLENLSTDNHYILKRPLIVELGYLDRLPSNIGELEELEQRMINESEDKEIDFSHLNRVLGEELGLKKLAKSKIMN